MQYKERDLDLGDYEQKRELAQQARPLMGGVYERAFDADHKDLSREGTFAIFRFGFWQVYS
jgi:hypothetical protein